VISSAQERDEAQYHVLMHKANCATFNFACRAKQDTYNVSHRYLLPACWLMISIGPDTRSVWHNTDHAS
jgi:hypothetical protein